MNWLLDRPLNASVKTQSQQYEEQFKASVKDKKGRCYNKLECKGLFTRAIFTAILGAIFSAISMARKNRTCEQPAILLRLSKFTSPISQMFLTCINFTAILVRFSSPKKSYLRSP